jgi:hypothetical protein
VASIATFNVNNLFVRYRFGQRFPGDMSGKSAVRDALVGYLPIYEQSAFRLFNPLQPQAVMSAYRREGPRRRARRATSRCFRGFERAAFPGLAGSVSPRPRLLAHRRWCMSSTSADWRD